MLFYIINQSSEVVETFDTIGHEPTIKSAQKDAMKIAFANGYTYKDGYHLVDEFENNITLVDPWKSLEWKRII